jgi:hypothetical protein
MMDDDRPYEGADDLGRLGETVLDVPMENQAAQKATVERPDDAKYDRRDNRDICLPGTTSRANAPAIRPMTMMLTMRPNMMCPPILACMPTSR